MFAVVTKYETFETIETSVTQEQTKTKLREDESKCDETMYFGIPNDNPPRSSYNMECFP